jgi:flagellar protein FlgJ
MKADDLSSQRFVLDLKTAGDLRARIKQDPQAGLKEAAQQFEAMLLQMMLKSMRETTAQDGLMDSDQSRFYTGILDQQLAQNLSGKLGFARLIEQQLGAQLPATGAGSDTAETSPAVSLEALQQALLARRAASSAAGQPTADGAARVRNSPVSAGAAVAGASSPEATRSGPGDFVNALWPHAAEAAASIGVPPHFLVAHAALESGWGKGEIRRADGTPTHNLFGVKAGRSWSGPTVEVQTTEYVNGVAQSVREKFRAYGSYAEAFADYASLLRNNGRFAGVLGQQDGTQFARSLQNAGYATDPQYADKLARIINGGTLRQALAG